MDIVFATNNDFCRHAAVAIISLLTNNSNEDIVIHLFSIDVEIKNLQNLGKVVSQFNNAQLKVYQINKDLFGKFPNPGIYSLASYLRLLTPSLLPSISKVLYLDCDIIVNNSIKELWNIDIQDYACAAVYDSVMSYGIVKDYLEYDYYKEGYANSGMLLINLEYWRKNSIQEKLITFLNTHKVKLPDQDAINIILHGSIKFIHPKWNCQTSYFSFPPLVRPDQKKYINDLWKHAIIIHFIGPVKPWFIECINPYKKIYIRYSKQTPWKYKKLLPLENNLFKRHFIISLRHLKNIVAKCFSYFYK